MKLNKSAATNSQNVHNFRICKNDMKVIYIRKQMEIFLMYLSCAHHKNAKTHIHKIQKTDENIIKYFNVKIILFYLYRESTYILILYTFYFTIYFF